MTIEFDSNLPPLHPKVPPAVPIDTLLAVERVTLMAGDVPRGVLREFYTRILGLTFVGADEQSVQFIHLKRQIVLERDRVEPGRLGLLVRGFTEALQRLKERSIAHEVIHADAGLSRTAILRDPAGNWIHLVETRPF